MKMRFSCQNRQNVLVFPTKTAKTRCPLRIPSTLVRGKGEKGERGEKGEKGARESKESGESGDRREKGKEERGGVRESRVRNGGRVQEAKGWP